MEKKTTTKNTGYIYAKGGRKTATSGCRLVKAGSGKIEVNGIEFKKYFPTEELQRVTLTPLTLTNNLKSFDISMRVTGGGKAGQAGACRHSIARALVLLDETLRPALKAEGLMTRDPRVKERKKPGLRGARRAPQWSKR
ncbi:MAG: 30S ribosomal protein S9 [bacterium]